MGLGPQHVATPRFCERAHRRARALSWCLLLGLLFFFPFFRCAQSRSRCLLERCVCLSCWSCWPGAHSPWRTRRAPRPRAFWPSRRRSRTLPRPPCRARRARCTPTVRRPSTAFASAGTSCRSAPLRAPPRPPLPCAMIAWPSFAATATARASSFRSSRPWRLACRSSRLRLRSVVRASRRRPLSSSSCVPFAPSSPRTSS